MSAKAAVSCVIGFAFAFKLGISAVASEAYMATELRLFDLTEAIKFAFLGMVA
jgi:hypothetical protein